MASSGIAPSYSKMLDSEMERHLRSNCKHLLNTRVLSEFQKVSLCFIDYSKATDCEDREQLWGTLKEMSVPQHLTVLILTRIVDRQPFSGRNMERQNGFLETKVSDKDAFYLPIRLICMQNTSCERLS